MENNIKFALIIDKLNQKIAELNIKISKNSDNEFLKQELNKLLSDRDLLYNGNRDDLINIMNKYGEMINE